MGQKTNSNIFRLGIKQNEWYSKYFEHNKEESTLYNYQNIQIYTYLKNFLNRQGLLFQNYKLHFNKNNLYIFISYFSMKRTNTIINKEKQNQFIDFKNKTIKKQKSFTEYQKDLKLSSFFKYEKQKKFQKRNITKTKINKIKRIYLLKKYKQSLNSKSYITNENLTKNNIIEQILESLSKFTNKKFHIFLIFQNINRGMSVNLSKEEQKFLRKKFLFLKRYSKNKFFKESLNIVFVITKIKNSAKILAEFLALQISLLKRHNHFLIFFKTLLIFFINSKFTKIKGIKIVINGRFNGAPRAKNRLILIGNIPIQTIDNSVDYYQTISYTRNGTFGIKVWIN